MPDCFVRGEENVAENAGRDPVFPMVDPDWYVDGTGREWDGISSSKASAKGVDGDVGSILLVSDGSRIVSALLSSEQRCIARVCGDRQSAGIWDPADAGSHGEKRNCKKK